MSIEPNDQLDEVTAARLAKLRAMPVDRSRLKKAILSQIPQPGAQARIFPAAWLRPLQAAAGFILLVSAIAFFVTNSSRPVLASAEQLAEVHEDVVAGRGILHVDSVAEANKAILAQWANSPQIPDVPTDHVMACCMRSIRDRKVACILLKGESEPVTLTVANASDMAMPNTPSTYRDGVGYQVTSRGALNMVMTQRQARWICLIGRIPAERLMALAGGLQF